MSVVDTYRDVAQALADLNPQAIINLKAPKTMDKRVQELVEKKKETNLTIEETTELERYLSLDLLINLAKARAKGILSQ